MLGFGEAGEAVPPPLTTEEYEGEVGPPNSIRTEKMALVSRRKEIGRSDSVVTTQGSLLGIVVVRPKESRAPSVIHGQT